VNFPHVVLVLGLLGLQHKSKSFLGLQYNKCLKKGKVVGVRKEVN